MSIPHRSPLFGVLCATLLFALVAFSARAHQVGPAGALQAQLAASAVAGTGTVAELIVDNRVTNVTRRYLALRFDGGEIVELTGTGVEALTSGARVEVTGGLTAGTLAVTSFRVLASPQVANKAAAASRKQVQGTLVIFHKDYFAQGRGEYGLGVHSGTGQMTPLNLPVVPGELQAGMTVSVSGTLAADGVALDASQITILAPPPEQTGPVSLTTTNNVLVMPIKFTDSPAGDPFTPAQVDQVMRTNAGSVANYYNEVSYGKQQLNITVACSTTVPAGCAAHTSTGGWLLASAATPANCDFTTIGNLADQAATAAGYNLANYKNRFYVMPGLSCGWAGLAYIGYPYQAWSNAYNELWVYGHELGHNFTLYHAGSLNCSPQVIGGGCNVAEYGDRFDVMGNNSNPGQQMHFNAAQKSILNWIPASSVATHTSGSATYTLGPLESAGQSTYAIKIPVTADANRTYWIEYRQPIGFDSGIAAYPNNGAQIRVAYPFDFPCGGCGGDDTELLDMTPATSGNFYDAALVAGQSYVDATYGINVIVLSATPSALTVSVTTSGGAATTTTLTSSANPSNVGANVTFTASVTGSSPTGTVNFTDGGVSIAGCAAVTLSGAGNTRTAACTTNTFVAGAHSIVATYAGDAANNVSTSATLSQVVKTTSSTSLASSANPSVIGASVTFTATVTGTAPTGSVGFTADGTTLTGCAAVALPGGSANSKSATCSTASLAVGTHSIVATYAGDAVNSGSISATLSQVVNATGSINIALGGNGGVASASSTYSSGYAASGAIDNVRSGANWGNGGGWNDATPNSFPDWLQVNFSASQSINRVVVYSVQDNYQNPVEPTDTMTFSRYGLVDFTVQGWNGTSWVTLGTVSGNNLVKRTVTFSTYTTDRIRINVTSALNTWSRITEVEAWTATSTPSTTTLSSSANPSNLGASVTFTATINGSAPTGSVGFTADGVTVTGCGAVALPTGSANSKSATCSTSSLAVGTHSIVATYAGDAANNGSVSATLSQVVNTSGSLNVALASNGGVASASSTYSAAYPAVAVNNNERAGVNWGNGGGWNDATPNSFPDWVQINFSGAKIIDHVVVYSVQDNYQNPVEPTDTMTFSLYGLVDFTVQGWDGANWVTLGTVSGNNLVKRTVNFSPYTTDRIRINVTNALNTWSRITEVEAWGTNAGSTNVALASSGGVASASTTYGSGYPASAINNNERAGTNPGNGGYWNDATPNSFPDWVQINFSGAKTIDHAVVYSVQDNYQSPVEPTDTMTFSLYGLVDFTVQGWDGANWLTLGTVSGNNLVKRTVTFSPYSTDRIRINVTNALNGYSRITEVEAWGN